MLIGREWVDFGGTKVRLDVLKIKNRFVNHKEELVRGEREVQEMEGCARLNWGVCLQSFETSHHGESLCRCGPPPHLLSYAWVNKRVLGRGGRRQCSQMIGIIEQVNKSSFRNRAYRLIRLTA